MDVTTPTLTSPTPYGPTAVEAPVVASDYETFLLMMTTQLQNQDPLDPMDSDQFAVQLATFSGVEQQVLTNDLLTELTAQSTMQSMAQMAGWVGKEARVAAPVYFDGEPITLSPNPAVAADKTVLVVTDLDGVEVARQEIPVTTAPYAWTGLDAAGNPLPDGIYNLTLENYAGTELLGTTEVEHYSVIEEARSVAGGTTLLFEGGIEVPALYVTALREPVPPAPLP
jgi:flagellar basal-body rod modification protein FlgD